MFKMKIQVRAAFKELLEGDRIMLSTYQYQMTWFERWILNRIFKRLFVQSHQHQNNITQVFQLMRDTCNNYFTEDNASTMDVFMLDCIEPTLQSEHFSDRVRSITK